jgi:hypothetical protein
MPCETPRSKGRARKFFGTLAATTLSVLVLASPSFGEGLDVNDNGVYCSLTVGSVVQPSTIHDVTVDDNVMFAGARGICVSRFTPVAR